MSESRKQFENPTPGLFHGAYLAEVIDLNDPDNLSRVKVRLYNFDGIDGHDGPVWARVALPFAGNNRGTFFIPDTGDEVLVTFVNGDSRHPIVIGGLWNGNNSAPASISSGNNEQKVICSKNGVKITLEDKNGQEKFITETPGGQKITLKDGPGAVTIEDSNGNSIKLESSGVTINASAKVNITASQVSVSAGMFQVDAGMSKFSGVVNCDTLISNTVVSSTYTPGAGNIW